MCSWSANKICAWLTGQREKRISSTSFSEEVFLCDTPPLSSPYPTGASTFVPSHLSSKLKHSQSWSTISPQGLKSRSSRGLSLGGERGQRADRQVEKLSPASPEQLNFYRRTRSTKDSRELSSPKKTGEIFSKAKEQHHSPKKSESQAQEVALSRSRVSPTQAKTQFTSPRKSPQAAQLVASTLQHAEHQQHPQRRLKASSSKDGLDHKKKNGKEGNVDIIKYTHGGETEGRRERTRPGLEQESFKRRVAGQSHTTSPPIVRESEKGGATASGQRDANGKDKSTDERKTSKQTIGKRESLLPFKDLWSRKGSVVSAREAKGVEDTFSYSTESISKLDFVASTNHIPGPLQSPKGPISPKPWKIPSSVKILTLPEALRDPLWYNIESCRCELCHGLFNSTPNGWFFSVLPQKRKVQNCATFTTTGLRPDLSFDKFFGSPVTSRVACSHFPLPCPSLQRLCCGSSACAACSGPCRTRHFEMWICANPGSLLWNSPSPITMQWPICKEGKGPCLSPAVYTKCDRHPGFHCGIFCLFLKSLLNCMQSAFLFHLLHVFSTSRGWSRS